VLNRYCYFLINCKDRKQHVGKDNTRVTNSSVVVANAESTTYKYFQGVIYFMSTYNISHVVVYNDYTM